MNLDTNKNLVKHEVIDFREETRQNFKVVHGLAKRLRSILVEMDWTGRELARQAGLKSESHVSTILKSGDAKVGTLVKIAEAGRVRFEWLAIGVGERRSADQALPTSEVRPSRSQA